MTELLAELQIKFRDQFVETARGRVRQVAAAAETGEAGAASRALHALAGEAAILGFHAIRDAAKAGEDRFAGESIAIDRATPIIASLNRMIDEIADPPSAGGEVATTDDSDHRKVLLIDDSELSLKFAAAILRSAGYEVRTTTDVQSFGQVLADWAPNLILIDVQMPGTSGPHLCRMLKGRVETARVPVILFSSLPEEQLAKLARACSADGYLSKLDGMERLSEEIDSLWDTILW